MVTAEHRELEEECPQCTAGILSMCILQVCTCDRRRQGFHGEKLRGEPLPVGVKSVKPGEHSLQRMFVNCAHQQMCVHGPESAYGRATSLIARPTRPTSTNSGHQDRGRAAHEKSRTYHVAVIARGLLFYGIRACKKLTPSHL
ncbi:MAG TPA: hypothetical protein VK141_05150 [Nitrosomonas sp.]|nr:hypothetical protein [Nitrosomonas sp.]